MRYFQQQGRCQETLYQLGAGAKFSHRILLFAIVQQVLEYIYKK